MAGFFLAVANRKGGVGKSTTAVMIAYAFAVWGKKKVLMIDLDSQSNSSLIMIGGARWIEAQKQSLNIAAYIEDKMYEAKPISDYIIKEVGDISGLNGRAPAVSLLPGSLRFEDMQDELITQYSRHNASFQNAKNRCADHFNRNLKSAASLADLIVMDCAPGLSNATAAALKLADKVIVPFRPDAVSEFAVDRISTIIEGKDFEDVLAIDPQKRRYICLANSIRPGGRDQIAVDTIAAKHPMLATRIPMLQDLASAFDWSEERQTLEEKYGEAIAPMRALYSEVSKIVTK